MQTNLKRFFQIGLAILLGLIIIILFDKTIPIVAKFTGFVSSLIGPFIAGFIIAYLLVGIVDFLERKGLKRILAVFLVFFFFLGVISLIIITLVPILINELKHFGHLAPNLWNTLDQWLENLFKQLDFIPDSYHFTLSDIGNYIIEMVDFQPRIDLGKIFNAFSLIFLVPIAAFYFLLEYHQIKHKLKRVFIRNKQFIVIRYFRDLDIGMGRYLKGLMIVINILGLMATILFWIIGLEYAILFGLLIGYFDIIPYIGPWFGAAPAVVFAFTKDVSTGFLVLLIVVVLQIFENNVLTPLIQSKATDIRPFFIVIALTIFGRLFGVFGMILAVPLLFFIMLTAHYIRMVLRLKNIRKLDANWFKRAA